MRDFNNDGEINVQGDFNITDSSSNQYKPLTHCSNEELLQERPFRQGNLKREQAAKFKRLSPFYAFSLVLLVAAATWYTVKGKGDLATLIMGMAGLFVGYLTLRATVEPNAFQVEEQRAVSEINKILKQRRVE